MPHSRPNRINSLRARMTLGFAAAIALLMFFACGGLIGYARYVAEQNALERLDSTAQKVRRELTALTPERELGEIAEQGRDLADEHLTLMRVTAQNQLVLVSPGRHPDWPHPSRRDWRIASFPYGADTFVIGLPWRRTEDSLRAQRWALALLSGTVIITGTLGAWLLVGRTLAPIDTLAQQAEQVSVEKLSVRLYPPSQDAELVRLVATLNSLLTRLSESASMQGRFYAAASHELRTPLQALTGHLQLALTRERTASEYRTVIEEADTQSRRLAALVRDLLMLNRLDTASPPLMEPTCLADVCAQAFWAIENLIEAKQLRVETNGRETMKILAPPMHTAMLIGNLVENAVKYAVSGGRIHVEVVALPEAARFILFNECAPVVGWDARRIFEPFFRPDASRHTSTGGNGLGLAICKAICDANGWLIEIRQETGGVLACVTFPQHLEPINEKLCEPFSS